MTRPRWKRKREEVMNRLDYIAKVSYHQGRVEYRVNGEDHLISFKKEGHSNQEKWAMFFQSAKNIIIKAYRDIALDKSDKMTKKYLLYDDTDSILADIFIQIDGVWKDEGEPKIIEPTEVKFKQ